MEVPELSMEQEPPAEAASSIPWHFWLMVAAVTLYLGYRIVQGLMALF